MILYIIVYYNTIIIKNNTLETVNLFNSIAFIYMKKLY